MKNNILSGQINMFNIPTIDEDEQKIEKIEVQKQPVLPKEIFEMTEKFKSLISKYSKECNRIATRGKNLLIEVKDNTLIYAPDGTLECTLIQNVSLRPCDKLIIENVEKLVNEKQIKTLKKIKTNTFIKRKSDDNIIIPNEFFDITIYPSGNFAKWTSKGNYKDNEIFPIGDIDNFIIASDCSDINFTENNKNGSLADQENNISCCVDEKTDNIDNANVYSDYYSHDMKDCYSSEQDEILVDKLGRKLGDKVTFDYEGKQVGTIVYIYNHGESVNVSWNNKQTSMYYKSIKKYGE